MKRLIVLGASGSIGKTVLDIVKKNPNRFTVVGVSVHHSVEDLLGIIRLHNCSSAAVGGGHEADIVRRHFPNIELYVGEKGLAAFSAQENVDTLVNGIVGIAGLSPSCAFLESGNGTLITANKESLVVGGPLLKKAAGGSRERIRSIDSEHAALADLLIGRSKEDIAHLTLTASGGSLRDTPIKDYPKASVEQVLAHPTWSMGKKITVDCATMMNKAFEIMEAEFLFGFEMEKIKAVIHRESCVHGIVGYKDGSSHAYLGSSNMRDTIWRGLLDEIEKKEDAQSLLQTIPQSLSFSAVDSERYPLFYGAIEVGRRGGLSRVVLNSVNEYAVHAFLEAKIRFDQITALVFDVLSTHNGSLSDPLTWENMTETHHEVVSQCASWLRTHS